MLFILEEAKECFSNMQGNESWRHVIQPHSSVSLESWNDIFVQSWLPTAMISGAMVSLLLWNMLGVSPNNSFRAPFSGSQFAWIARFPYARAAQDTIQESYDRFRDCAWKLSGNDIIVLPRRYVEEIRALPLFKANAMEANLETLQGKFTNLSVLNSTRLFVDVLKMKLNPQLGVLMPTLRKELDECMAMEIPPSAGKEWVSVEAFQTFHKINGRISARLFGGKELRDNSRFLGSTEGFLMNTFITAMSLRLVPSGFKTLFSWLLPCSWSISMNFQRAIAVLIPYIESRQKDFDRRAVEVATNGKIDFPDILHYLIELAEGEDAKPRSLAAMILSLSLASNQTTTMALVEALYDLCAYPEYQMELREEVVTALNTEGGWHKTAMTKMRKLDSFIKESQRMHPPAFMGYKRKFRESVTLADGTVVPSGAHVEFAITSIQNESVSSPEHFDGFRYYRMRQDPAEGHKHQFASTSETSLHFGHGKYSCPGRFMSASLIKMTLGSLLIDYEFKLSEGDRPESIHVFEFNFPNPKTRLLLKRRTERAASL